MWPKIQCVCDLCAAICTSDKPAFEAHEIKVEHKGWLVYLGMPAHRSGKSSLMVFLPMAPSLNLHTKGHNYRPQFWAGELKVTAENSTAGSNTNFLVGILQGLGPPDGHPLGESSGVSSLA